MKLERFICLKKSDKTGKNDNVGINNKCTSLLKNDSLKKNISFRD